MPILKSLLENFKIKICLSAAFIFFTFLPPDFAYQLTSYSKNQKAPINLVFIPLGYPDKESFLKDVKELTEKLTITTPFNEFPGAFRIWMIDLTAKEQNLFFGTSGVFPYFSVRSDLLEKIQQGVKGTYKGIVISFSGSTSCAELSSANKFSLLIIGRNRYKDKNSFAKGFLHELGHSFGLRDECWKCAATDMGFPNCAKDKNEANQWWGDLTVGSERAGYFPGCCGRPDCIRPTSISLMNDPNKANDYGPVNERYLHNKMEEITKKWHFKK